MKNTTLQKQPTQKAFVGKQYNYNEIVEFLDAHWSVAKKPATTQSEKAQNNPLYCIKRLDEAFGSISKKIDAVLIAGSNGKSLTTHFTSRLIKEESLVVGSFYSPHITTYNERLVCNNESITNTLFTDLGNEVIAMAQKLNITPDTLDILTMMSLLYFKAHNVDIAIIEAARNGSVCPTSIFKPKIIAVTRMTDIEDYDEQETVTALVKDLLYPMLPGTHVVCADQSKFNLQTMQKIVGESGGHWSMPIRKLAPLNYPFEQLHGRCAALAERIAQIYVDSYANKEDVIVLNSLLTKQKGLRGRPTLKAKRESELNPKKTMEQFWQETQSTLPGRFQMLASERPAVLLDTATNLDSFKNLLLGVRLLHYQRPLKGLVLILGCDNEQLKMLEFSKLLRYFFKKASGQVIVCPTTPMPGNKGTVSWTPEKVVEEIKNLKIKAKVGKSFKEAFESAQKHVDERLGLIVIAGSPSIVTEYWNQKNANKF